MNKQFIWKNFNLGKELSISGIFLYNGLKAFDELKTFYYEDEIFEFLYNISVGIERLSKIAIILTEHEDVSDQESFEKSLITHSHPDLIRRIKTKHCINLSNSHNSFLQLLGNFYRTMRYDRYNLNDAYSYDKEKQALQEFIGNELNIKFEENTPFSVTENNDRIKKFIGKIIGKISTSLYEIIYHEASRQNIYTYELRVDSKAFKIFMRKEFDFINEKILWKELLIFLLNNREDEGVIKFIKSIDPLNFDPALIQDYLGSFESEVNKLQIFDELETLYEDVENIKERLEMLNLIANPNVYFDSDIDEDLA